MLQVHVPDLIDAKAQEVQMQTKIMMESMIEGQTKAEQAAHRQKIESKLRQTVFRMQQSAVAYCFFMWRENVEFIGRMEEVKRKTVNLLRNRVRPVSLPFAAFLQVLVAMFSLPAPFAADEVLIELLASRVEWPFATASR